MAYTFNPAKIISAQQSALDSLLSFGLLSLSCIEKINALNLSTTRNLVASQLESGAQLLGAGSLKDAVSLQEKLAQPQLGKIAAYTREIMEIASETQDALLELQEQQQAEIDGTIHALLDEYATTPGKNDVAISAVRSAISAANTAFTNAQKAARQVAGYASNGISATMQVMDAANQSRGSARKQTA